ncbi:hypothetical protein BDF19DRAFT_411489 [Syncephalis fuscata]|nr:hypothetical protein BDF19DRAFT_411489 [Syncephalis fuscata]
MGVTTSQLGKEPYGTGNPHQQYPHCQDKAEGDTNEKAKAQAASALLPNTVDLQRDLSPHQYLSKMALEEIDLVPASAPASIKGDEDRYGYNEFGNGQMPGKELMQRLPGSSRGIAHEQRLICDAGHSSNVAKMKKTVAGCLAKNREKLKRSKTGPALYLMPEQTHHQTNSSPCSPSPDSGAAVTQYYVHVPIKQASGIKLNQDASTAFISFYTTWKHILEKSGEQQSQMQRQMSVSRRTSPTTRFFPRWRACQQTDSVSYCARCITGVCVEFLESRKDLASRDHLVQQLLRYVIRKDYAAPITKPRRILDIGAKDGAWIVSMGKQFPSCKIRGCEGFSLDESSKSALSPNCRIDIVNLCKPFSNVCSITRTPYSDGYFDYIHQRMMSFYTPLEVWAFRISDAYRMLRPGGYIELVELDPDIAPLGRCCKILNGWMKENLLAQGIDIKLLQLAGFTDIHHHAVEIPIGSWGSVRGEFTWRFMKMLYFSVYKAILAIPHDIDPNDTLIYWARNMARLPALPDDFDTIPSSPIDPNKDPFMALARSAKNEVNVERATAKFHFYWARKP